MTLLFLLIPFLFGACSLIHQEPPNQPPVFEGSYIDTLRVRRGGQITLAVHVSDEDDDPLYYTWNSFGSGSFRDSTRSGTSWIAPLVTQGRSESFVLQVTIRDRQCDIIPDPTDRQRCEEEASQIVETFVVEVLQTPPTLAPIADTTISFNEPLVALEAVAEDVDGDPLSYQWEQLSGRDIGFSPEDLTRPHLSFVPFSLDDYLLGLEVSDGMDTVSTQVTVHVVPEQILPAGGTVQLVLPSIGREYEIDVYEYPSRKGELPLLVDSWFEAAQFCAAQGMRLCSPGEWQHACQGEEGLPYSSPDVNFSDDPSFGLRFCNTQGSEFVGDTSDIEAGLAPSGSFANCASTAGVFDLTGNVREWVGSINVSGQWVGGSSRSDVLLSLPCDSFSEFEALPPEFDFSDQAQIEGLDRITYGGYQGRAGFRCCR